MQTKARAVTAGGETQSEGSDWVFFPMQRMDECRMPLPCRLDEKRALRAGKDVGSVFCGLRKGVAQVRFDVARGYETQKDAIQVPSR